MPRATLEREIAVQSPPRGFIKALERATDEGRFALIAEIKKASPSKGVIREDFDPAALAKAYQVGRRGMSLGADRRPVVPGTAEHLIKARKATALPILRKDFPFDPYQVLEARAWGADCILIIMAAIDDETAKTLNKAAHDLGLDVLIETHNEAELKRALALEGRLIGINNRDLRTFDDFARCLRAAEAADSKRQNRGRGERHLQPCRLQASGEGRYRDFPRWRGADATKDVAGATRSLLTGQ